MACTRSPPPSCGRQDVSALHLISHGAPARLTLGSLTLDSDALARHARRSGHRARRLARRRRPVHLWLQRRRGRRHCAFIDQLAAATGARVAASTNLTGAADQGGDWVLEARTAAMRSAALAFPAYRMVLPTVAGTVTIPFSHPDGSFFTSMMVDGQINTGTTDIALAVVYQFYFAASGNTLTGTATNIDLAGGTGSMLLYHSGIGYDPVASFIIKSQSNRMFGLFSFQDSGCTRAGLQLHGLRLPATMSSSAATRSTSAAASIPCSSRYPPVSPTSMKSG
ncbi:DUF4347 domain-containing protein [Massilia sp. H-1]|nr:DUF4347 domain-containing protein [Massilia sp. H-1]